MKKSILRNYAKLIVRKGVSIRKGEDVVITCGLDQPEFVEYVAAECYAAGARKVTVDFSYDPIYRLGVKRMSLKTLSKVEEWELSKLEHYAETEPARIYLESSDPDAMKGIDNEKYAKAMQARFKLIKPIRDRMENRYKWCIAAVPGEKWAKKLFPELRKGAAVEKLWEAILYASRADSEDPIAEWDRHNKDIEGRCAYLNSLGIKELIYRSANGTDFRVGMIEDAGFCGGAEPILSGEMFNANIPSEEVYVSPMKGKAEGIVYSTKPLCYNGQLIENFSISFKNGKVSEVHAEKNEDLLKTIISMDEGASYLGEVALVPYTSPINRLGFLFYNTLFDENAACHLALGRGFTNTIRNYERYSNEELLAKGVNDSAVHVDFMIGSEDLSVTAVLKNGGKRSIFRDGVWAF